MRIGLGEALGGAAGDGSLRGRRGFLPAFLDRVREHGGRDGAGRRGRGGRLRRDAVVRRQSTGGGRRGSDSPHGFVFERTVNYSHVDEIRDRFSYGLGYGLRDGLFQGRSASAAVRASGI